MQKKFIAILFVCFNFFLNTINCNAETYYISDTHFGHENIIKYCSRPFKNIDDMHRQLIQNWNSTVTPEDEVYIIGDFAYGMSSKKEVFEILEQLNGKKHLLIGNHDKHWLAEASDEELLMHFETLPSYMIIVYDSERKIGLCHYPIVSFPGTIIHGHIHNNRNPKDGWEFIKNNPNILNASVEVNGYAPVTLTQLIDNNTVFKSES